MVIHRGGLPAHQKLSKYTVKYRLRLDTTFQLVKDGFCTKSIKGNHKMQVWSDLLVIYYVIP